MSMNTQKKINEILKEAKWSQEELARHLNVSFKALNAWVTGKTEPHMHNAEALERLYFEVVGRTEVDKTYLENLKRKTLSTHLELRELLNHDE